MDEALVGFADGLRGRTVLLYDGVCVMCNRTIRVLLAADPAHRLRFTPIEGQLGRALLARHPKLAEQAGAGRLERVVVIEDALTGTERVWTRSEAAIRAMRQLRRPWPLAARLLGLVPRAIRDFGYGIVARLRYPVFGRLTQCPLPTEAERPWILVRTDDVLADHRSWRKGSS